MARRGFWARLLLRSGQANVEYAMGAIVIGLVVLFLATGFGSGVSKRFHCMTLQLGLVKIDPSSPTAMTDEEGCGGSVAVAAIPPAPLPGDPLQAEVRHHLGDGKCAVGSSCGGNLIPEGLSMTVPVKLTQEQLDYAKEHGNQIVLSFDGSGIDLIDTVSFGGAALPNAVNGANSVTIDTSQLGPGDYALTFNAGPNPNAQPGADYDDYEVNNIKVVFSTTS
jgi:hypothetical protein